MLPIRWDPLRELGTFHRHIDDLFRRSFGLARGEEGSLFSPMINAYVKGGTYCIEAEIPGVDKKDLELHMEGNVLTLRGERKMSKETKEEDYYLKESQYGSFMRRLTLPEGANTEQLHASYDKGVLKITMPIDKKAIAGRRIEIEALEESKPAAGGKEKSEQMH
jgi:HSP20 family protein